MRLTLRTLLAYLDGNLEPDDAEDIGKKIEESEFATKLVHLIRDCMRRPRLGSPALMGRGLGADPNTVAEYLEYRLGDDRVPEFERICLESEAHLAEVASCHQILTLVLGEPAEADPQMRQRLYALSAYANAPPVQTEAMQPAGMQPVAPLASLASAPPVAQAAPPQVTPRRAKPEVPEYLRESRWSLWPVAALVLVAAGLTFAGLFFFGPESVRERMTAMISPQEATDEVAPEPDAATKAADAVVPAPAPLEDPYAEPSDAPPPPEAAVPNAAAPDATVPDGAAPDDAVVAPADDDAAMPAENPAAPAGEVPSTEPAADAPAPGAVDPAAPAPAGEAGALRPVPSIVAPGTAATPDPTAIPPEPGPLAPDGAAPVPMPADAVPDPAGTTPAGTAPAGTPSEAQPGAPAARPPAEGFGRYTSTKREVLLKLDPASGDWVRLPAASPLNKGDQLLSLPLFRPTITLSSNITIQADGAARFELAGWNEQGAPIINLEYGRLLMLTIGKAANPLVLQVGGEPVLLTFVDPESTLAVEARRQLPPGKDPSAEAPMSAQLYATSGLLRVERSDGNLQELQAPARLALAGGAAGEPADKADFPAWVTREQQSDLDRRAAGDVDGYLSPDRSAGFQLRELTDPQHKLGRRRENRTLAIRCLAHLGNFEPSLAALNDADMRHAWEDVLGELQAAIARSPETAARVHAVMVKQRGAADGDALFRMLWGYNAQDLQSGSDRELVERLDRNDALDMRVVSFLTLKKLAGGASLGYFPENTPYERRVPYNSWKNRIGKLVPRSGGAPARTRPPATKGNSTKGNPPAAKGN